MSELYESGSGIELENSSQQSQMRKPEDNTGVHQDGAVHGQKAVASSDSKEGVKPAADHVEGQHDVHTTWSKEEKSEVHPPKKQNPFV